MIERFKIEFENSSKKVNEAADEPRRKQTTPSNLGRFFLDEMKEVRSMKDTKDTFNSVSSASPINIVTPVKSFSEVSKKDSDLIIKSLNGELSTIDSRSLSDNTNEYSLSNNTHSAIKCYVKSRRNSESEDFSKKHCSAFDPNDENVKNSSDCGLILQSASMEESHSSENRPSLVGTSDEAYQNKICF